jgi:hypothetical protein
VAEGGPEAGIPESLRAVLGKVSPDSSQVTSAEGRPIQKLFMDPDVTAREIKVQ